MAKNKNVKATPDGVGEDVNFRKTINRAIVHFNPDAILEVEFNSDTKELKAKVGTLSGTVVLTGGK